MQLFPADYGRHLGLNEKHLFLPLREAFRHLGPVLRELAAPCLPEPGLISHSDFAGNTIVRKTAQVETVKGTLQIKHSEIKPVATRPFSSP